MRVLVTGGSGYLGTHVRAFFDADDFSRRSGLDLMNGADAARVSEYDVVVHLAAMLDKRPEAAEECFKTNAEGTARLLPHVRPGAAFVYASTKDVYGPHADAYEEVPESCPTDYAGQSALEWSKLLAERYVEYYAHQRSFRACVFRLSAVYARPSAGNEPGFVTHYVESVKRRRPIRLPAGGSPVRDLLHVNDFSRACRAFVESGRSYGLYNLGGGRANAASLRELVETVGRMIEIEPLVEDGGRLPKEAPFRYVSDLSRVKRELNWRPEIGIEEGLRSLL